MVKYARLVAPELGSCGSSDRAWWLWAARHSQGRGVRPLGAQPLPRVLLELARASRLQTRVADKDSAAFDHIGVGQWDAAPRGASGR